MKKRFAKLLAAVAMFATGMASVGCTWFVIEEPDSMSVFADS